MSMFCFQCQETAKNSGCTIRGVCGKHDDTANLQDLLIYVTRGIALAAEKGLEGGVVETEAAAFINRALFATITNANFDNTRFEKLIPEGLKLRDELVKK